MSETDSRARRGRGGGGVGAVHVDRDVAAVRGDLHGTRQEQRDGIRQQPVLDGLDALAQRRLVVVGQDRDRLLGHDRTAVERGVDQVDRHPGHAHAVRERIANGVGTRERRQQRRMRVQDPSRERLQDARPHHPHVAGKDDDIRPSPREGLQQRPVITALDERGIDPLLCGPVERRTRPVREDQDDVSAELTAHGGSLQRPQVGARPRHADGDPPTHATDSRLPSV